MPHPGPGHSEPLPLRQATADLYLHRRYSNTQRHVWLSLCGVSWCAQAFLCTSEYLWQEWGWILNMILLLLPYFWGFSFALGHRVSLPPPPPPPVWSNILLSVVVQQQVVIWSSHRRWVHILLLHHLVKCFLSLLAKIKCSICSYQFN